MLLFGKFVVMCVVVVCSCVLYFGLCLWLRLLLLWFLSGVVMFVLCVVCVWI